MTASKKKMCKENLHLKVGITTIAMAKQGE